MGCGAMARLEVAAVAVAIGEGAALDRAPGPPDTPYADEGDVAADAGERDSR